jgi:tetratricopeptide (TPR) repeat protein
MVPDRSATLRNAEKLLRIGKIAAAIAEYEKVVRDSPQDWDTATALAALHVRAGQIDAAVDRYRGIAAGVAAKGDHARAAGVHERILALRPGDEDSLEQLADLCAAAGDTDTACSHLQRIADRRIARGDLPRAIDALEQAASLDPSARGGASRLFELCVQSGDLSRARRHATSARQYRALATLMQHAGLAGDARDLLREACRRDPSDLGTPAVLARDYLLEGDVAGAADFLTPAVVGDDPAVRMAATEVLLSAGRADAAMALIESAVSTLTAQHAWDRALDVLEQFVAAVPDHPPVLIRLIEVAVDADRLDTAARGQELLAEAYLAHGEVAEGLAIAEDLSDRDPENTRYAALLERARLRTRSAEETVSVPLRAAR